MRYFAIALLLAATCMPLIYCYSEEAELDMDNEVADLMLQEIPISTPHPRRHCLGIRCAFPNCPKPIWEGCCPVCPTTKPDLCDGFECPSNSVCRVFTPPFGKEFGVVEEPYCDPSCELNNGGCKADEICRLLPPLCPPDLPCPFIVNCLQKQKDPCENFECPSNAKCEVFHSFVTREAFCQPSCELNNGGCAKGELCSLKQVQCVRAPCPSEVVCRKKASGPVVMATLEDTPSIPEVCYLPKVAGPCRGYIPRYYYNHKTGQCQMFIYGGCGGNKNNFETKLKCDKTCGSIPHTLPKVCYLPSVAGPCEAYIPSYYYNHKTGQCQKFIYGGCGGNGNRFETKFECLRACGSGFPE